MPQEGLIVPGNIDLFNRPKVANPAGGTSTVYSMSFEENGREILIPRVSDDGRILTEQEAMDAYHRTGKHLGIFTDPRSATQFAEQLHNDYAAGKYEPLKGRSLAYLGGPAPLPTLGALSLQKFPR